MGNIMDFVDKLFWQCVYFIEFLGNTSGLGYELTNLLLFVVIQPLIILILILLLFREKARYRKLINDSLQKDTSFANEILWRISRIISIFVLTLEFYLFYILYQNQFYLSFFKDIYDFFNNLIITNIFISLILPIILIFLNFLIFGKFSLWVKRP
tara:strand:- start:189 stop:653 length:465 start_codon:yes stop_codon:yes gene_type:complete